MSRRIDEEALRELLRSPLDEPPPTWSAVTRRRVAAVVAALAGGVAVVALLAAFDRGGPAETAATTAGPTVSSTSPSDRTSGLPDGYVAVSPDMGLRAEWIYEREGVIYVAVSGVVASGADRESVTDLPGGIWTIRLTDGQRVAFRRTHVDPAAPGITTVEIPAFGVTLDEIAALEVVPASESRVVETTSLIDTGSLPWTGPGTPIRLDLDADVTVVVDDVALDTGRGRVAWHLEGDPGVRAIVVPTVFTTVGGERVSLLDVEHTVPVRFAQLNEAPPTPLRSGSTLLERYRPTIDREDVTAVEIVWSIVWQRYEADPVALAVDATPRAG